MMPGNPVPHAQGALVTLLPPPIATGAGGGHIHSGANPIVVNGRSYTAAIGTSLQVPAHDADQMMANGWTPFAHASGTTAQRPTGIAAARGTLYLDTTLAAVICFDGYTWRNSAGAAV